MKELTVSPIVERKMKQGIHVLDARDFPQLGLANTLVQLVSQHGSFLGQAYLSSQNKGIGWLISREKVPVNQAFFQHLFGTARAKRRAFEASDTTTAYRLFNQDGDGFGGITIDRYNDYAVFSWYNEYVYSKKEEMIRAFRTIYPDIQGAYEKIRFKGAGYESAHLYGEEAPATFTVRENGVAYQVFLNVGLMTGIFLDQHEVRGSLVDGLAAGKTLLNMFSYTAAFSVAAAMGGASQTTSVDLAKRSKELSEAHFKVNALAVDNHRFLVMDVFEYFKYAKRKGLSYDIIVLDPPSFARNKKQTFSVAKDYHRLIAQSLDILNAEGILIASTNASNVSLEAFKKEIEKGFGGCKHRYLETYRLPSDFVSNQKDESSNYLKVFTIQVKK
ncbi:MULTISPECIES: class I SAM-dependent rRNA methyltransferase [unclassified Streptococcus]|uniref:class I SAM-dependent rRNA methyltransferase n=1 Tax=unclassified Streptococcus TaxID=2608887 RepID=UPI0010727533|nr:MULTISPECIES: class I SAM-dependent rRNA methyltransferase [unclassified Streptococcus]MBF0786890.1 class I SAM-dependent rRNA methyltransferase [Streptococcus sp. 19428wC2_LYSM12]MCQ9212699.1 class I SAM-dependent rRNA methyltransferase [Streptococcus sp. B01]MCQ9214040.1 class I SAM-dependent rRNA methyltransferase [Streptococcus sp. O1]TFV06258.1 class I SAM-dependent rRNA methyltransferase [Streptococcus sp. LYSM12]